MIEENNDEKTIKNYRATEKKLISQKNDLIIERDKAIDFFNRERDTEIKVIRDLQKEIEKVRLKYDNLIADVDMIIELRRSILKDELTTCYTINKKKNEDK